MPATIGDVTSRLTLDTASFDAKLNKSGELLDRHGALTEKASARARAAWEKELLAQEKAQRALEQTNRVKELAALKSDILARSVEKEAQAVEHAGHASVSQMQATSAAVRSLEGNPGIRATERFLTTLPGVGQALQAAFPIVGAVAFGSIIVEEIEKVHQFIEETKKLPTAIREGFNELNDATHKTGVELDIANDKLGIQIAMLEHKPANLLKLALDEDRLAAANLADEIDRAAKKVDELLKKGHVGVMRQIASFFTGTPYDSTAPVEKRIKDTFDSLQKAKDAALDAEEAATPGADAERVKAQNRVNIGSVLSTAIRNISSDLAKQQLAGSDDKFASHDPQIEMLRGSLRQLQAEKHNFEAGNDKSDQEVRLKADQERAKAAEEQKKADAEAIKRMEAAHREWEALEDRSKGDEVAYWAARIASLKAGSALYIEAMKKSQEAIIALNRENATAIRTFTKSYMEEFNKTGGSLTPEADKLNEKAQGSFARDYIQSLRASIDGQKANADAIAKASIEMQVATGNMTRLGAAQAIAALHAQEYAEAMEKLDDAEALALGMSEGMEKSARLNNIRTSREALDTSRAIQVQHDQLATGGRDTSALVGATDALNDFIAATRDGARQMHDFVGHALSGFNSEAVKALSGQRTSFGNFGAGLFRDVAGAALQKGEGNILSMLGLGGKAKPTGAVGDALHVIVDNSMTGGASGNLSSVLSQAASAYANDQAGGGIGTIASTALQLLPMFAEGGPISADTMAIVGERGPELFMPGVNGHIVPNHKLDSVGGGGDTHHWNVDARGAQDPAAVERAVMKAAPHIAAAAVKAVSENKMRRPSTRR